MDDAVTIKMHVPNHEPTVNFYSWSNFSWSLIDQTVS